MSIALAPTITWGNVVGFAPELATLAAETQDLVVALANEAFPNASMFGAAQLRMLRLNLAAHFGTLEKRRGSGVAGPLVSESVGGVSRSYAQQIGTSRVFVGSSYGDAATQILAMSGARLPRVIGCGRPW